MNNVTIIFPHQLFENNPALRSGRQDYLIEEYLFFRQYSFHKMKIHYQRPSMQFYSSHLSNKGISVNYINAEDNLFDVREFIRGVYLFVGAEQRTSNIWKFKNEIPASFYKRATGIEPVDSTIKKILNTGYAHHIERLMVLGNFMLLCKFNSHSVYEWFMELFIDSYDWVMVPNIYGMSQFANVGLMSSKSYISSSNYIRKMSDYKSGDWTLIWDSLYWRFIKKHSDFFSSNARSAFEAKNIEKMKSDVLNKKINTAEKYLQSLS